MDFVSWFSTYGCLCKTHENMQLKHFEKKIHFYDNGFLNIVVKKVKIYSETLTHFLNYTLYKKVMKYYANLQFSIG